VVKARLIAKCAACNVALIPNEPQACRQSGCQIPGLFDGTRAGDEDIH
jgi:hypothetical protein